MPGIELATIWLVDRHADHSGNEQCVIVIQNFIMKNKGMYWYLFKVIDYLKQISIFRC